MDKFAGVFADVNIMAHILPGLLVLAFVIAADRVFARSRGENPKVPLPSDGLTLALVLLAASAFVGLIIDGLRSTWPQDVAVQCLWKYPFPDQAYYGLFTRPDLTIVKQIHQDYFRYYQLYFNTVMAMAIGCTILCSSLMAGRKWFLAAFVAVAGIVMSVSLMDAAHRSYIHFCRIVAKVAESQ